MINEDARVFIQGRVNAEDDKPSKLILEKVRAFDDIPREIWIQFKDREDYAQKEQELLNYLRGSVGTSDGSNLPQRCEGDKTSSGRIPCADQRFSVRRIKEKIW